MHVRSSRSDRTRDSTIAFPMTRGVLETECADRLKRSSLAARAGEEVASRAASLSRAAASAASSSHRVAARAT